MLHSQIPWRAPLCKPIKKAQECMYVYYWPSVTVDTGAMSRPHVSPHSSEVFAFWIATEYSLKFKHHLIDHRFLRLWSKSPVMSSRLFISGSTPARSLSTGQPRHCNPQSIRTHTCKVLKALRLVWERKQLVLSGDTRTDVSFCRCNLKRI